MIWSCSTLDAFNDAKETFKSLDIVCNNAGILDLTHREVLHGSSKEGDLAKKLLDVNLVNVCIYCCSFS